MNEPAWIEARLAIAAHDEALIEAGGLAGLRDEGALASALHLPRNKWSYGEQSLAVLAAAYGYCVAKNHPFADGNKRTAYLVMELFLAKNGIDFEPSEVEAVLVLEGLAAGTVSEVELAEWIGKSIVA
jgi:death on curing protein